MSSFDRTALCVNVLSEGFIDSYIELFYLSQRYNEEGSLQPCQLSEDELILLKENLVMAEVSKRKNDLFGRHAAYKNIGRYFASNKESESALYFFTKCDELFADADTFLDLALTYESLKETANAIKFHQKYAQVCQQKGDENGILLANKNLIRSLKRQSDQMVECGEYEKAMAVLEECAVFAQTAHDLAGQQIAHCGIANIALFKLGTYQKAALHYKKCIKLSLELEDVDGECSGYRNLGKTYQQIGDYILATKYFESYLKVARLHNNIEAEAEAAAALGDIYCLCNKHEDAQKYYRRLNTESARIKLAIAKSKQQMPKYLNAILNKNDLKPLIQWKNKRKTID